MSERYCTEDLALPRPIVTCDINLGNIYSNIEIDTAWIAQTLFEHNIPLGDIGQTQVLISAETPDDGVLGSRLGDYNNSLRLTRVFAGHKVPNAYLKAPDSASEWEQSSQRDLGCSQFYSGHLKHELKHQIIWATGEAADEVSRHEQKKKFIRFLGASVIGLAYGAIMFGGGELAANFLPTAAQFIDGSLFGGLVAAGFPIGIWANNRFKTWAYATDPAEIRCNTFAQKTRGLPLWFEYRRDGNIISDTPKP